MHNSLNFCPDFAQRKLVVLCGLVQAHSVGDDVKVLREVHRADGHARDALSGEAMRRVDLNVRLPPAHCLPVSIEKKILSRDGEEDILVVLLDFRLAEDVEAMLVEIIPCGDDALAKPVDELTHATESSPHSGIDAEALVQLVQPVLAILLELSLHVAVDICAEACLRK